MKGLTCIAISLILMFVSPALAKQKALIVEGFDSPESITFDGEYYYVSNMGKNLAPTAKDNDGFISKLSRDGKVVDRHFLPRKGFLNSPKGLAIAGDILLAADVDRLAGFDLKTGEKTIDIDFSSAGTKYLNAIAVKDENTVFVSASDAGKIFKVNICCTYHFEALITQINGPNGLWWDEDNSVLYVVGWGSGKPDGRVGAVTVGSAGAWYKTIGDYRGFLDGAVLENSARLLFSDWIAFEKKGEVKAMNLGSGEVTTIPTPELIGGPADFYLNRFDATLAIPMMMEGKVMFVPYGG
ncbi:hypothetical protein MNBD_NITROSPINAE02-1110 [hydrothermal vent metagenome]|uniref:SMP-30/Gluconolactonase/LRE-like region domain-containing protein n=1 Tax=hydrothermal vent metagenome TaxID=652676 RepID=A0A3B1CP03_9ZZZZ